MYHIKAQDWPNGQTSLHKTMGDLQEFAKERGEIPSTEPRDVGADEILLDKLTSNNGIIWAQN